MDISAIGLGSELTEGVLQKKQESEIGRFKEILEKAASKEKSSKEEDEELMKACKEVEAYMLTTIFKQMKQSTTWGEELIPKGDYEKMFEDMMVQDQCESMTEAGGIGLAKMMYKQLSRT